MSGAAESQGQTDLPEPSGRGFEAVLPNPKLKLLDQVRKVLRLRHYSIRTEQSYRDRIPRYVKYHGMRREVLIMWRLEPCPEKEKGAIFQIRAVHGRRLS